MNKQSCQSPVASCQSRVTRHGSSLATNNWKLANAFTVTELLVVIGIIVLAMAMAVPALNLITGNKSTQAASNSISAMLALARNEAIGLQEIRGLMFYYDPSEDRVTIARVEEVDPPSTGTIYNVDVYLDLVANADQMPLPKGVMVQTCDDAGGGPIPLNDRYLGFNNAAYLIPTNTIQRYYGGVILFDSRGQMVSKSYAFQTHRKNLDIVGNPEQYTPMGVLLFGKDMTDIVASPADKDIVPVEPSTPNITNKLVIRSQIGFVLCDLETFKSNYTLEDFQVTGATYPSSAEEIEETWIDNNAVASLINRYNGTLVKGE